MLKPTVTINTSMPAVRAAGSTELTVKVKIQVPAPPNSGPSLPLNIGFAVDRSGSMSGEKIEFARQALKDAFAQLSPGSRVAVAAFSNSVTVVLSSTAVEDLREVDRKIASIQSGGMTALFEGWKQAAAEVEAHFSPKRLNRVILLSDGLANVGPSRKEEIVPFVRALAQKGISTTAMGVGLDFDEHMMEAISDAGDGTYFFIEHPNQLPTFFEAELSGVNQLVATAGRLGFLPAPGCTLLELVTDQPIDSKVVVHTWLEHEAPGVFDLQGVKSGQLTPQWCVLPGLMAQRTITVVARLRIEQGVAPAALGDFFLSWIPAGDEVRYAERCASPVLQRVPDDVYQTYVEDREVHVSNVKARGRRMMREMNSSLAMNDVLGFERKMAALERDLFSIEENASDELKDIIAMKESFMKKDYERAKKQAHSSSYNRRSNE